jgi:DNA ligase (NAD+)
MSFENGNQALPQDARMRSLVDKINGANKAYYENDDPVMSDAEWDKLYYELVLLEKEAGIRLPDSPTHRVGGQPLAVFLQHRHLNRLWSMDKVQDMSGLDSWVLRVNKLAAQADVHKAVSYFVEYKLDGLTLNLTYNHGELVQAATRGNGEVGEAILPQARTVRSVPLAIPYQGLLEVQGECIMRLSVLKKYNETSPEPLKNARNAAAGALRNLDPAVTASRKLDAFFYQVGTIFPPESEPNTNGAANPPYSDQAGMIAFLEENGFPLSPYRKEAKNIDEIRDRIKEISESRESLDFLIDGAVVKVSDFALRNAMGYTDKFPRWALAYKFEAEENITTLLNVVWEPGRTGKLTPLAHLEPVDFGGVTVKRATLNNWGDIQRKKVAIGCKVWIRRSNDVIPEIMGRMGEPEEGETAIEKPDRCPSCGGPITERGAHLYCMNRADCRPQAVARIAHFAGRDAMDIETFSDKTAGLMYDMFGLRDPAGLYSLTKEQLLTLEGFKEKKADNLLKALEESRRCPLDAFLFALGIPNVGRKTARDLANHFTSLDKLKAASLQELTDIPEVGDVVAQSIVDFFSFPENIEMIDRLLNAGVTPQEAKKAEGGALSGLTVVVTGTLPSLSRGEAEDLIRRHGGVASGSVSRKTAFVLCGESAGSKLQKAQELGIPVIDEAEFLKRIEKKE